MYGYDQNQGQVFSCATNSRCLQSSVGLPRVGKDVTIILYLQELEEDQRGLDQEEKIKKLRTKIDKVQAELDRLAEELKTLQKAEDLVQC